MASEEGEFLVDLECGGVTTNNATTSEEVGNGDSISSCRTGRNTLNRASSGALTFNGIMSSESETDSSDNGRVELVIEKCAAGEEIGEVVALLDTKNPGEQRKKTNMKKSSKPPRPPKGPVLSASDLKLVKELSELAARKRARIERMKALRKMKETKRATSSNSLPAMVMTALFFIVIIFQGAFSGNNTRKELVESPAPATFNEGLISSYQLLNDAPTNEMNQLSSLSYNTLEQRSSLRPREDGRDER